MDSNILKKRDEIDKNFQSSGHNIEKNEDSVDGIEILVDMAKCGKINPWNIDIADVTDKFLQKLVEIKSNNLKLTGRTLFFAAVLLRLKSDVLEGISAITEEMLEGEEFIEEFDDEDTGIARVNLNNVISIDQVLERRRNIRLHRERVVTLEELIRQLEFYEKLDRKIALKNKPQKKMRSYENFTPEDIINMAHDEYIENSITHLQKILEKLFQSDSRIEMSELQQTGMDKVSIYIALLFLSARSRIELVQDKFYSDLYIVQG